MLSWAGAVLLSCLLFISGDSRLVQAYQRGRGRRIRKPEELEGVLKPQLGTGTVSCHPVLLAKPSQIDRLKSRVRLYTCLLVSFPLTCLLPPLWEAFPSLIAKNMNMEGVGWADLYPHLCLNL